MLYYCAFKQPDGKVIEITTEITDKVAQQLAQDKFRDLSRVFFTETSDAFTELADEMRLVYTAYGFDVKSIELKDSTTG
jgi:hypothetical protein